MASFSSVCFAQKRVFLSQRLKPLYPLALSTKLGVRRPCVASHVGYCTLLLNTKRNYLDIYLGDSHSVVLKKASVQARFESTAPNIPSSPREEQSRFQQFKKILYDFALGFKELCKDVWATLKIRRKLKGNGWNYSSLSRKDQWMMFKTQKNIKKTLPIVVLSCLPVIGYAGPVIGFLRPRQFLSHHFWTAKQKKRFPALDDKERSVHCDNILKDIKTCTTECKGTEYDLWHRLTVKIDQKFDLDNDDLLVFLPIFSTGIFKLENLPHTHLQNLCSFWLVPLSWLPNSLIQNRLRKEIITIHKDDAAIVREGVHALGQEEVEEACHVRGLNTTNASAEELVAWLQDWVELSIRVPESETSFLAHQGIFKILSNRQSSHHETKISAKSKE